MGGRSGAFLVLPYQMSVLGFTSPALSSTNLVFNIVAIPSGVYRYIREGRMARPLAWITIYVTLPGVLIGAILFGTFVTSNAGAIFYALIAQFYSNTGLMVAPDWLLGGLFSAGGFLGMYFGARPQKNCPARFIKVVLTILLLYLAVSYLLTSVQ